MDTGTVFCFVLVLSIASPCVSAMTTTVAPPTVMSQTPPVNNFTIDSSNGSVCILLSMAVRLNIKHPDLQSTATVDLGTPTFVHGWCGYEDGKSSIDIGFHGNWSLSLVFLKSSRTTYDWHEATLIYVLEPSVFVNISQNNANKEVSVIKVFDNGTNSADVGASFSCSRKTTLQLNENVSMEVTSLQYTAFQTSTMKWFSSEGVKNCLLDSPELDTDMTLAVTVGIALGVLIVVIIAMFLVISKGWNHDKEGD